MSNSGSDNTDASCGQEVGLTSSTPSNFLATEEMECNESAATTVPLTPLSGTTVSPDNPLYHSGQIHKGFAASNAFVYNWMTFDNKQAGHGLGGLKKAKGSFLSLSSSALASMENEAADGIPMDPTVQRQIPLQSSVEDKNFEDPCLSTYLQQAQHHHQQQQHLLTSAEDEVGLTMSLVGPSGSSAVHIQPQIQSISSLYGLDASRLSTNMDYKSEQHCRKEASDHASNNVYVSKERRILRQRSSSCSQLDACDENTTTSLHQLVQNWKKPAAAKVTVPPSSSSTINQSHTQEKPTSFSPLWSSTKVYEHLSRRLLRKYYSPQFAASTWLGFWALMHVTCANYVLTPMRDAIALQVGVAHMPKLTLASTLLAFGSSVPIGWLFEAPDPDRRKLFKRMGLTRGETQGTSLALFYRIFALGLLSYAVGFSLLGIIERNGKVAVVQLLAKIFRLFTTKDAEDTNSATPWFVESFHYLFQVAVRVLYVAFFLVVHLMKLHSLSLVWGVTTEAMEYEDVARKRYNKSSRGREGQHGKEMQTSEGRQLPATEEPQTISRMQRMALVSFGGTVGGVLGSGIASTLAQTLHLPGLLVVASVLLEIGAELSIELGRVMQKHWGEQQLFQSTSDLAAVDTSMRRSVSWGSMKRVASGNSLYRVKSADNIENRRLDQSSSSSLSSGGLSQDPRASSGTVLQHSSSLNSQYQSDEQNDDTFFQRLLRGVMTILRSRLLMSIFIYNSLYASTTVLLSFQRAELVASRNSSTNVQTDTAFLANINMASSIAIFVLQASGLGASLADRCGPRGTLTLMPLIRLAGVLALAWWHTVSNGEPPNLLVFLMVDECCKIMNLAVAKPVRESLWRGLSNEARYEAKPIVDTLANRWGGGSAAFFVHFIERTMDLLGLDYPTDGSKVRTIFGFPPLLALCLVISTWWAGVSIDLGQIRRNIDLELKKRL